MHRWWALALAPALAGCGGNGDGEDSGGPGFPQACDQSEVDGDCVLFSGSRWTEADIAGACEQGELLPDCPSAGSVGTCEIDGGTDEETITSFYAPFWTTPQGAAACQGNGGAWTPAG
jgi:hypothetical protein